MNKDEINRAIAEACGYTVEPCTCTKFAWRDAECGGHTPNFHGCLNAMAEAEKTLTDQQYEIYIDVLLDLTGEEAMKRGTKDLGEHAPDGPRKWGIDIPLGNIRTESAPANIRAAAFLRTIGQWKGGEG